MRLIIYMNIAITAIFTLCYAYQFVYVLISIFKKKEKLYAKQKHKYAFVIAARNESVVIKELISSIKAQDYPSERIEIFVIADNCSDNTGEIARSMGAVVYERNNTELIGKGYALDWFFKKAKKRLDMSAIDGYIFADADNVLDEKFVLEMNNVFDNGYEVVTGYRNSKNYDSNWISAGNGLYFLRDARYMNNPRMLTGSACAVAGTGFLVSKMIIDRNNGWVHHLLCEDTEFTVNEVMKGTKIGYASEAEFFDEQPTDYKQSFNQRLRWVKGYYQILRKYGTKLISRAIRGDFACFDMFMSVAPAVILMVVGLLFNIFAVLFAIVTHSSDLFIVLASLGSALFNIYWVFFVMGLITTITEWKKIYCSRFKKILYVFTFPIYTFTYIPIAFVALFKRVEWIPIKHNVVRNVKSVRKNSDMID